MRVTAGDKEFDIDPDDIDKVTMASEIEGIEAAYGKELSALRPVQRIRGFVWMLVKRQDPTVRFDGLDFDLADLPDLTESEPVPLSESPELAPST